MHQGNLKQLAFNEESKHVEMKLVKIEIITLIQNEAETYN